KSGSDEASIIQRRFVMNQNVTAHLACRDAADAILFYERAFGATPEAVHKMPDGTLMHAALLIDGSTIFLGEAAPEWGCMSPNDLGGSSVTLNLTVKDCDVAFKRAVDAGCSVKMPPEEMFWGDRYAVVVDPFGHRWSFAQHVRDVSAEEIE